MADFMRGADHNQCCGEFPKAFRHCVGATAEVLITQGMGTVAKSTIKLFIGTRGIMAEQSKIAIPVAARLLNTRSILFKTINFTN